VTGPVERLPGPVSREGYRRANGGSGSGLRAIRERAALLGGRVTTGPCDGEWRVRVELPVG
jgi:signal transduction histidine kinase